MSDQITSHTAGAMAQNDGDVHASGLVLTAGGAIEYNGGNIFERALFYYAEDRHDLVSIRALLFVNVIVITVLLVVLMCVVFSLLPIKSKVVYSHVAYDSVSADTVLTRDLEDNGTGRQKVGKYDSVRVRSLMEDTKVYGLTSAVVKILLESYVVATETYTSEEAYVKQIRFIEANSAEEIAQGYGQMLNHIRYGIASYEEKSRRVARILSTRFIEDDKCEISVEINTNDAIGAVVRDVKRVLIDYSIESLDPKKFNVSGRRLRFKVNSYRILG